jgi:hypothetical protein
VITGKGHHPLSKCGRRLLIVVTGSVSAPDPQQPATVLPALQYTGQPQVYHSIVIILNCELLNISGIYLTLNKETV